MERVSVVRIAFRRLTNPARHPPELLSCLKDPGYECRYEALRPGESPEGSALPRDLAKVQQPEDIGAGVSVVALEESRLSFKGLGSKFFFSRDFYDSLLQTLRRFERVVLLGNPGVGKPVFAYYNLWRTTREKDALSPDRTGNTRSPLSKRRHNLQVPLSSFLTG
jgi:hypothetical protein